jgi:hypothetical protein
MGWYGLGDALRVRTHNDESTRAFLAEKELVAKEQDSVSPAEARRGRGADIIVGTVIVLAAVLITVLTLTR